MEWVVPRYDGADDAHGLVLHSDPLVWHQSASFSVFISKAGFAAGNHPLELLACHQNLTEESIHRWFPAVTASHARYGVLVSHHKAKERSHQKPSLGKGRA